MSGETETWLGKGEKYALLGLNIKCDQAGFTDEQISPDLTVLTRSAFKMPSHWREWLGSIRAEEVEGCDLFILAKMKSKQIGVLDGENQALQAKVWAFYRGLLLASRFAAESLAQLRWAIVIGGCSGCFISMFRRGLNATCCIGCINTRAASMDWSSRGLAGARRISRLGPRCLSALAMTM